MSTPSHTPLPAYCVSLAVNDHRNGLSVDRVSAVDVDLRAAGRIRLDGPLNSEYARCHPVCRIDVEGLRLRLGRRVFPILGHRSWAGNWCWDAVWVTCPVLVELVVYLRDLGKFDVDEAPTEVWDAWRSEDPAALRTALTAII